MDIVLIYPFQNPAYRVVSQPFGPTSNTGEPKAGGYDHFHFGVDFLVPSGTPILAAADGVIEFAGADPYGYLDNGGYGNMVGITHAGGLATIYAHNQSLLVKTGDTVKQGQQISVSDSTGNSSGPHLHFGLNTLGSVLNKDSGWTNPIPAMGDAAGYNPQPYTTGANAVAPGYATLAQVVYYARTAGIPEDQVPTCAAIAQAESTLQIGAVGPTSAAGTPYGLWQIESSHGYDAARLKSDPQYNAYAMATIYKARGNWSDWETYDTGAYKAYLPASKTAAETTAIGQFPASSSAGSAPIMIDTTPELPVTQIRIDAVIPDESDLVYRRGLVPTAALRINGVTLPVTTLQYSKPQCRTEGQWQTTLPFSAFDSDDGDRVLDALFAREQTQVILSTGYVTPGKGGHPDPRDAKDKFTGLAYIPDIDDSTGVVTLHGPDLSGLFSQTGATASRLDSFVNTPADQAIQKIVARHNQASKAHPGGVQGLTTRIDSVAGTVGGIFGTDAVHTRTPTRTEWDVILAIADGEGMVAYFEGTTLVCRRVPPDGPAVRLYHRVPGQRSLLLPPRFRSQPHSKRDYVIYVYSYNTRRGTLKRAYQGNKDSPDNVDFYLPPNFSHDQMQKKADSLYATYSAMEYQSHLSFARPIAVTPTQPLIIVTGGPHRIYGRVMGPEHAYYALTTTTLFDVSKGITMDAVCSTRQPAILDKNHTGSVSV